MLHLDEKRGAKGGSDRDGNSRTITAKDKCIIRYSSLVFMNVLLHVITRSSPPMCVQPTQSW